VLSLTSYKEELVVDVNVEGSLGCSGHDRSEFRTLSGNRAKSRTATMDFKRSNSNLFRHLLRRILRDTALEVRSL